MNFKGFLAELSVGVDFSQVVSKIDGIIQMLKSVEPNIDNPLFLYSKSNIGGKEDVLQFFINALLEMRETTSRHARDMGLLKSITPLYKKLKQDMDKLNGGSEESKRAMKEFHVSETLASFYKMIQDMTKS